MSKKIHLGIDLSHSGIGIVDTMVTWRKSTVYEDENCQLPRSFANSSITNRNLRKSDLGGVIFGCKHETIEECLSKQLFGLPHAHFVYVRNIGEGLPLFLFNYSDRKLYGIFEAVSSGHMSYDAYAWTNGGAERTPYPAQVYIRIRKQCQPLPENLFSRAIQDNYYNPHHFWFELDHAQTRALLTMFKPSPANTMWSPLARSKKGLLPTTNPACNYGPSSRKEPFTAVSATTWKPTVNKESTTDVVNENKFASVLNIVDKASSSGFGDVESRGTNSDWEDLADDSVKNSSSGGSSQLDGSNTKGSSSSGASSQLDGSSTKGREKEEERVLRMLEKLAAERAHSKSFPNKEEHTTRSDCNHKNAEEMGIPTLAYFSHDNVENLQNSSTHKLDHNAELVQVIGQLKARTSNLEKQKAESVKEMHRLNNEVEYAEREIQLLKDRVEKLESLMVSSSALVHDPLDKATGQDFGSNHLIYLIGGFDGSSWLSSLESFSPELDILTPLRSMSSARSYASTVTVDGLLYVFGGGDGNLWFDSVESYDWRSDEWTAHPSMLREKGSLAGSVLNGKIFAIGGGNSGECFSDVEMFDPALGRWIANPSMLHTRFAPAAAQLGGVIYVTGGYNGNKYSRSVERFDPREGFWTELPSMKIGRGCHSLEILNEKLYSIGGYDGEAMVSSMEIFDPRLNYWVMGESMSRVRGYAASAVLDNSIFMIGGIQNEEHIVDKVECYREGAGWTSNDWKAIGDRCFCSAIAL